METPTLSDLEISKAATPTLLSVPMPNRPQVRVEIAVASQRENIIVGRRLPGVAGGAQ